MNFGKSNYLHLARIVRNNPFSTFHIHNFFEIYILFKGNLNFYVHQSCYHLQSRCVMFMNDRELHRYVNCNPDNVIDRAYIHIPQELLKRFSTDSTNLSECFSQRAPGEHNLIFPNNEEWEDIYRLYDLLEKTSASNEYGSDVLLNTYLFQLLVLLNRVFRRNDDIINPPTHFSSTISQVIEFIDQNYQNHISLDDIAAALNLSKYYMCHVFKQETDMTIIQYIQQKRISMAQLFLIDGMPATDVCYQTGFSDYANFIKTFKKISGYTPKEFRALLYR